MMRLKSKLLSLNANKTNKVKVYSPRNCEELRIPFKADKTAKVVGKLASIPPPAPSAPGEHQEPQLITGVLVQNDFKMSLMAPEDLREYAGLTTTTIACKQRLRLAAAGIDLIRWGLEGTFGSIDELEEKKEHENEANGNGAKTEEDDVQDDVLAAYLVMGCITVRCRASGEVELEWEGNMLNDGIADAVMAVLLSVESSPAAVKREFIPSRRTPSVTQGWIDKFLSPPFPIGSASKHSHSHDVFDLPKRNLHARLTPEERLERLFMFLEAQFGAENVAPVAEPKLAPLPRDGRSKKADGDVSDASMELSEDEEEEDRLVKARRKVELDRLHAAGIPVPGVAIKVDKMEATVWLEDLEVECNNRVFADRVRAVVETAVEVTAPLWG
jgi:cleavage and polyadenylation specificity factor subunit 3